MGGCEELLSHVEVILGEVVAAVHHLRVEVRLLLHRRLLLVLGMGWRRPWLLLLRWHLLLLEWHVPAWRVLLLQRHPSELLLEMRRRGSLLHATRRRRTLLLHPLGRLLGLEVACRRRNKIIMT